jgi:hypothetical protein
MTPPLGVLLAFALSHAVLGLAYLLALVGALNRARGLPPPAGRTTLVGR